MIKRVRKLRASESGFTLVEMLVVVAVIGILASVAVVAIGGTAKSSQAAACKADVATVQTASDAHFAKNNAYAANIAELKTEGYLRTDPSGKTVAADGYKLVYTAGVVTSDPADCAVA